GDHQHLAGAAELAGVQDHPAQARVDREAGELAADLGELRYALVARLLHSVELFEQAYAVDDVARLRRVDGRGARHLAEVQVGHAEDDRSQVGAQDLGIGELWPGLEVRFGVEPDADAVAGAAAPAFALVGRRLRDRLDRQPLDLGPVAVPGDARGSRVDHVL